jgi:hypothetical protein
MSYNLGECYFDHFTSYFRNVSTRDVFQQDAVNPTIQILGYDKVISRCRVFSSLGLSHYASEVGAIAEICCPVDDGWSSVPSIIANTLFYMVQDRVQIGRGVSVGSLQNVDQRFAHEFHKSAIYFTVPFGFPESFNTLDCGSARGSVFMAFFLSSAEHDFFLDHGTDRFEELLRRRDFDPFELSRESCI